MSQRLLEANQRSVAAAAHVNERVRLLQDRAVLLARLGRVAEAERTLSDAEQLMPEDAPRVLKLRFAYVRAIDAYFSKRFAGAQRKMYAALRDAHELHHRSNGAPFGFFASPWLLRSRCGAARTVAAAKE